MGGDASDFAARQLTSKIASSADLILTMTRDHRDAVLECAPHKLRRTFTLTEASQLVSDCGATTVEDLSTLRPQLAVHKVPDILDPIGRDMEAFSMVGAQIAELLPPIVDLCRGSMTPAFDRG